MSLLIRLPVGQSYRRSLHLSGYLLKGVFPQDAGDGFSSFAG
jgi:hypothetical protein